MAKSKYKQFKDHQEVEAKPGVGLNFACCDCGLVHDLQVRLENGKVFISFARDNRATGALRRHHDLPMVKRPTSDTCMSYQGRDESHDFTVL